MDVSRMIRPAYIWTWRGQWICGPRGTLQRCATKNMHVLEALLEGVLKKKIHAKQNSKLLGTQDES